MQQQYASLREKIAAETKARKERYAEFETLYAKAHEAGHAAAVAVNPVPMVVGEADGLSNRFKPGGQQWFVSEGVCGFAWIVVRPGNSSFARWLKKEKKASKDYYGGVSLWIRDYNQSMQRKEAYAHAFAGVLKAAGIEAYGQSRLD